MRNGQPVISEEGSIANASPVSHINDAFKNHVTTAEDWQYREITQLPHEWADRFNREFGLGIPTRARFNLD